MLFYFYAFIFYLYVRIAKTLDLGGYTWYGVLVLGVEIMGASTTFLYGLNIVARPVHEPPRPDDEVPGLVLVDHPYHVRVLVPVYKESLDIVAKTISAALAAKLPRGCGRTIYLCDDGKDAAKRRWCEAAGDDVVYVSGRTRKPGEMNGKSANLNNCLSHIYPPDLAMPPHELVCIFDADQVANADFFLKTLPLFDAGDDVGMVLSPQVSFFFFLPFFPLLPSIFFFFSSFLATARYLASPRSVLSDDGNKTGKWLTKQNKKLIGKKKHNNSASTTSTRTPTSLTTATFSSGSTRRPGTTRLDSSPAPVPTSWCGLARSRRQGE